MFTIPDTYQLIHKINLWNVGIFITALIVISLSVKVIRMLSEFFSKRFSSKRMLIFAWIPLINFLLYFVGIFISFYTIFEPTREFLITSLVSSFFAIGFALKDLITSMIAGIVLLIDKPFQVGDRITFEKHYGEVITIGLRSVKILTLDEDIVTIANNRFLNDCVSSSSAGDLGMMVSVDVYLLPTFDLYQIRKILEEEAIKSIYRESQGKIIIVGKEILGLDNSIFFMMTVKCIIKDARLEKEFQTDFLLRVNNKFKAKNLLAV